MGNCPSSYLFNLTIMPNINITNKYDFTKMTVREVSTVSGSTEPVTLAEAKNWLRIDNTDDDTRITSLITAARRRAEQYMRRDVIAKNREVFWTTLQEEVNIPYTVNAISQVTVDGATQTVDEDYELLGTGNAIFRLEVYPSEKIQVTYTTSAFAGDEVNIGILMIIEEMYYGNKTQWKYVLSPFKVFGYYGVK